MILYFLTIVKLFPCATADIQVSGDGNITVCRYINCNIEWSRNHNLYTIDGEYTLSLYLQG